MSNTRTNSKKKVILSIESDSPVDLYWLRRGKVRPETNLDKTTKGEGTIICDHFWDDFVIVAKAVYIRNKEADLFDVFNFIREQFLGGWTMLEDSDFIKNIDAQIEREYQRNNNGNL